MGPQRDDVWRETRIIDHFATNGPPVQWRVPVRAGYVGPAVVSGRVFLMDRKAGPPVKRVKGDRSVPKIPGNERVLCLDARTGDVVWEQSYDCPYTIAYPSGPRATPIVSGDVVFTLGSMGDLRAQKATDGQLLWVRHLPGEFHTEPPVWGYASHPLLDGERLIVPVGGTNSALVAFQASDGREVWRALSAEEIGYAPPVLRTIAGRRQVIFWHPDAISGLDPATGKLLWSHQYPIEGRLQRPEVTIAAPRFHDDEVFLTSFYHGCVLLRVPRAGSEAAVIWNRHSSKNTEFNDGLHTVMSTPFIQEGCIYGIGAMGELRCLDLTSGDRRWESLEVFDGKGGFFASAFIVQQADRQWIWNDHGELILGKISPEGFAVISRARLLDPIENTRGRDVLWCHPAFADRCMFVHNGRELLCLDLAAHDA